MVYSQKYFSRKVIHTKLKKVHSTEEFFLVSDGTTHAHGPNIHKATEDYKFKLIAEKLKNDPIKEDTLLTVMYYRTLTGACDLGCRQWMEQNNVPFNIVGDSTVEKEPIKAKDLLPLLEKSKPYGYEKFKSLLTF
jgi:hypothetical protein